MSNKNYGYDLLIWSTAVRKPMQQNLLHHKSEMVCVQQQIETSDHALAKFLSFSHLSHSLPLRAHIQTFLR